MIARHFGGIGFNVSYHVTDTPSFCSGTRICVSDPLSKVCDEGGELDLTNAHESLVTPPSHCPGCGRALRWIENIPVLSYLWLRGQCAGCRTQISKTYPLVELATAVTFATAYQVFGPGWLLVSRLVFAGVMIVLLVIDLQHRILPNVVTIPGAVVGLLFSLLAPPGWRSALIGLAAGGGVLLVIAEAYYRVRGEEGLGMGDVKMLAMIGAFLGWKLMLVTLIVASFLGSIVGVMMIVADRRNLKYALPFGSFLAVAALLASVTGDAMLAWYLSLY